MSQKGVPFLVFLLIVFVSAWNATAQTPQDLYARGMQAARRGEYPKALQDLHRAVDLHPEFAKAHAGLGTIYLQLGDFDASEAALKRALAITPGLLYAGMLPHKHLKIFTCAVSQAARRGEYPKAAIEPKLPMANGNLGAIYQKQGELEKALALRNGCPSGPSAARYCLGLVSQRNFSAHGGIPLSLPKHTPVFRQRFTSNSVTLMRRRRHSRFNARRSVTGCHCVR